MSEPLTVLIVEDSEDDALLVLRELRRSGFDPTWKRVQTAESLQLALANQPWDAIISDYRLPGFDARAALEIVQQSQLDLPFIVVSGTIGEMAAVAMMKEGAHDYLMKDNLTRLAEAVRREVREALVRAERRQAEVRLHQTAKREQLIRMLTERIRQSLDLDDILTTTVIEVRQVLQTDRVILFKLTLNEWGYVAQESVGAGWLSILGRDIYDPCLQPEDVRYFEGHIRAIDNIDDGSIQPCYARFLRQFQVRANLVVPIIQPEGLWGLLIAHHCTQARQWTEDEIQLLKQLADQVAIAIQQANLYRQVQLELAERQRAEAALQQLNQELEQRVQERTQSLQQQAEQERLLRLIVQNIHRSLDFEEILTTVLNETRQTLQVDRVAVYQFASDWSGQFVAESVGEGWIPLVGEGTQPIWEEDTDPQETQSKPFQDYQTFIVNDIHAVGSHPCYTSLLEQFQTKAYVMTPIFLDNQLWGLFAACQNSSIRDWQVWEVSLLQQISIQMAIALRQSRLYQTAQTQVKALERLSQLKDDFLSTVSHELRSPLANIKMAIQMVKLSLKQQHIQNDRLTRYVEILEESCTQELALINDLLDLQRLEAGVQPLELERIDLNSWLTETAEPFVARAQEQQQKLHIDIPPDLPCLITDSSALKRVIVELLHNACKYTPPHEQITLTAQAEATIVKIRVCNSGVELPPEELPHLFDKFYRVTRVDRWKHGGTGLGLALVKRLVEHLNGSIEANSSNSFICFIVQLPLSTE